jgi:DNA-directed RNA polymerase specialized sigma24 family protein
MQADLARVESAVTAVKAGDPSALHYLYARYADGVRAYVESMVGSRIQADEITKATFLKLPRAIPAYEAGTLPFEGWLLRLARAAALDHLRGRQEMSPERLEVLALRHLVGLTTSEIPVRPDRPAPLDPPVPLNSPGIQLTRPGLLAAAKPETARPDAATLYHHGAMERRR